MRELAIVGVAAAAYLFLAFFRSGTFIWTLSPQEGGLWLDEAARVLRGERMYRDFFDFVAPVNVHAIAGWLALFGETPRAAGALVVAQGTLAAVLLHALGRHLLPLAWRACATALFLVYVFVPYSPLNHKWPTLAFAVAALLVLARGRGPGRCAAAGAALAGATLSTQDMGAGAALGLAAGLGWLHRHESARPAAIFCAAYAIALALLIAALSAWAGASTVWYDLVTFPATQYGEAVKMAVSLGEAHAAVRTFTVLALCVAAFTFAARRGDAGAESSLVTLVLALGAGMLLVGSWARPLEPVALAARALPVLLVGTYALHRWVEARPWPERSLLAFFAVTLSVTAAIQIAYAQWLGPFVAREHRAGATWEPAPLEDLAWLEAHAKEGEWVFLWPYKGGYSFLSRTRAASSYPMVMDMGFSTQDQLRRAAGELAASCPVAGLWDHRRQRDPVDRSSLLPLYRDVQRRYESRGRLAGDVEAFVRGPGACRS